MVDWEDFLEDEFFRKIYISEVKVGNDFIDVFWYFYVRKFWLEDL